MIVPVSHVPIKAYESHEPPYIHNLVGTSIAIMASIFDNRGLIPLLICIPISPLEQNQLHLCNPDH